MTFDSSIIEKIAPDYWRNSHMSIARFYGGIYIDSKHYTLDPETDYLVRDDVMAREKKLTKERMKEWENQAEKAQWRLF